MHCVADNNHDDGGGVDDVIEIHLLTSLSSHARAKYHNEFNVSVKC